MSELQPLYDQVDQLCRDRVERNARIQELEATMREVAEELRGLDIDYVANSTFTDLADRLSPPPVVEKPPA